MLYASMSPAIKKVGPEMVTRIQSPSGGCILSSKSTKVGCMRVLVLTSYVPYPPDHGGKIHVVNQMRYVSRDHHVTLMCPVRPDSGQAEDALKLVGEYCTDVKPIPWQKRSKLRFLPHLFRYVRAGEPIGNLIFYFEELASALRHLTAEQHFDVVNVYNAYMAPYLDAIAPQSNCKTILSLQNIPYQQWRRMMMVERNLPRKLTLFRDWLFQKHATLKHIQRYDKTITISESDRSILLKDAPHANIVAVPAGMDTDGIKPLSEPSEFCNLMFVGSMFYQPNIDAALFLCREIFPLIKREISHRPPIHCWHKTAQRGASFRGAIGRGHRDRTRGQRAPILRTMLSHPRSPARRAAVSGSRSWSRWRWGGPSFRPRWDVKGCR